VPRITVNGKEYEVAEGRMILQALDDLGLLMTEVDIPHYCWHPKLSIDGSCRMCQVELDGVPKLQIACNTPVRDGMSIRTDSERVREAQRSVMELLLINHPLDCPICDQAGVGVACASAARFRRPASSASSPAAIVLCSRSSRDSSSTTPTP
jgi:NADH-quinone oxidoreductase subunit G